MSPRGQGPFSASAGCGPFFAFRSPPLTYMLRDVGRETVTAAKANAKQMGYSLDQVLKAAIAACADPTAFHYNIVTDQSWLRVPLESLRAHSR